MSAKTSGADPKPNGNSAQNRQHHDGSNGRAFTVEQKDAVVRIRKCAPTAFYDILGLESERTTVTDGGIKKAYRKLSLLTHPDKNGYTGSDEAFKSKCLSWCGKELCRARSTTPSGTYMASPPRETSTAATNIVSLQWYPVPSKSSQTQTRR